MSICLINKLLIAEFENYKATKIADFDIERTKIYKL